MKPNFNNCSDIKGLRFFTKEICPYYCRFLHTQKDSEGASIHRIDESFPLKPSLVPKLFIRTSWLVKFAKLRPIRLGSSIVDLTPPRHTVQE